MKNLITCNNNYVFYAFSIIKKYKMEVPMLIHYDLICLIVMISSVDCGTPKTHSFY